MLYILGDILDMWFYQASTQENNEGPASTSCVFVREVGSRLRVVRDAKTRCPKVVVVFENRQIMEHYRPQSENKVPT